MAKKTKKRKEHVRQREQIYRGIPLEDLKVMDVRESAKYLKSRARRAVLRNFDTIEQFIVRCDARLAKNKKIRTHLRDIVIVPKLVGYTIAVYNGKEFKEVLLTIEMIGCRLGEFSLTRVKAVHTSMGTGGSKGSAKLKK